jgi:hypothetical protein
VAHFYSLSESQITHIFATFRDGWNSADRLDYPVEAFPRLGEATMKRASEKEQCPS